MLTGREIREARTDSGRRSPRRTFDEGTRSLQPGISRTIAAENKGPGECCGPGRHLRGALASKQSYLQSFFSNLV